MAQQRLGLRAPSKACIDYHDQHVREVPAQVVQCDEIWAFLYAKRKNMEQAMAAPDEAGDVWTWTAIDSDTKLLISWAVSTSRDGATALDLMDDLRARTANRFQLTTDGPLESTTMTSMCARFRLRSCSAMRFGHSCTPSARTWSKRWRPPDEAGDVWTWTAIDSDTKLLISWAVSTSRDGATALDLMDDLRARTANRFQLTTDGLSAYPGAVEGAFGGNVDFAQLIKIYADAPREEARRYSPSECVGTRQEVVVGDPDERLISTSHVERHNLTMRMSMRRFTRLTNAFSKKYENHCYAQALYFTYYNFCRPHSTLTRRNNGYKTTPAMAAGLTDRVYDMAWLSDLASGYFPEPNRPSTYKRRAENS